MSMQFVVEGSSGQEGRCKQIEQLLTRSLEALLPTKDIDLSQHFVDLGGDSLTATRLMSALSEELRADLSPILPFEAESLRELILRVESLVPSSTAATVQR